MPQPIMKTPIAARAATKDGVLRYILAISLALVVLLFIASYLIA